MSEPLTRYTIRRDIGHGFIEDAHGDWVKYQDCIAQLHTQTELWRKTNAEYERVSKAMCHVQTELVSQTERAEKASEEADSLRASCHTFEQQVADLTAKLAATKTECASRIRVFSDERWHAQHELTTVTRERNGLQLQLNELRQRFSPGMRWSDRALKAEQQLAASEQRCNELKEAEKSTAFRHYDTISEIQQTARDIVKESEQRVKRLENELCTAKDQIPADMKEDSLSVALIKLKDERAQKLQQQLAEAKATIARLQHTICEDHIIESRISDERDQLQATVDELHNKCRGYTDELKDMHNQRRDLESTSTAQAQEIGRLRDWMKDIDKACRDQQGGNRNWKLCVDPHSFLGRIATAIIQALASGKVGA